MQLTMFVYIDKMCAMLRTNFPKGDNGTITVLDYIYAIDSRIKRIRRTT